MTVIWDTEKDSDSNSCLLFLSVFRAEPGDNKETQCFLMLLLKRQTDAGEKTFYLCHRDDNCLKITM